MAPLDDPAVGQAARRDTANAASSPANDARNAIGTQPGRSPDAALGAFLKVRAESEALSAPLSPEDWMVQSMEEASPVKWNLAHTTWFFETFILEKHVDGYASFDPSFGFLFNSYYNQIGDMHARPKRGVLSRPSADEVLGYRRHVTDAMTTLLRGADAALMRTLAPLVALGCAHEQQHQELLLTDVKHALYQNPFPSPAFALQEGQAAGEASAVSEALTWETFEGGLAEIGCSGEGFAFDNEGPLHQVLLKPFALSDRLVTNADYLAFMEGGGYETPRWWLADGWERVLSEKWRAPLYWRKTDAGWRSYTLYGEQPLRPDAPVMHLSYYEAAAYAEWTGYRLPTEVEWEQAAKEALQRDDSSSACGVFLENANPRPPAPAGEGGGVKQLFGDVWEWTASPYVAYPGYRAASGAIGEYNGKFMSSQMVLRGGSCATPVGHIRATYRNFFPPHARWQFAGLRLARDL